MLSMLLSTSLIWSKDLTNRRDGIGKHRSGLRLVNAQRRKLRVGGRSKCRNRPTPAGFSKEVFGVLARSFLDSGFSGNVGPAIEESGVDLEGLC